MIKIYKTIKEEFTISKHNFLPEIKLALEEAENGNGEALIDLLYTYYYDGDMRVINGEKDLNWMIECALAYNIPVHDVLTGKIDLDILRFLDVRFDINETISELPQKQERKSKKINNKEKIVQFKKKEEE